MSWRPSTGTAPHSGPAIAIAATVARPESVYAPSFWPSWTPRRSHSVKEADPRAILIGRRSGCSLGVWWALKSNAELFAAIRRDARAEGRHVGDLRTFVGSLDGR